MNSSGDHSLEERLSLRAASILLHSPCSISLLLLVIVLPPWTTPSIALCLLHPFRLPLSLRFLHLGRLHRWASLFFTPHTSLLPQLPAPAEKPLHGPEGLIHRSQTSTQPPPYLHHGDSRGKQTRVGVNTLISPQTSR